MDQDRSRWDPLHFWLGLAALERAESGLDSLAITDALLREPSLRGYHLLPSVRGDLLWKLVRLAGARAEFKRASSLTQNARERTLLQERAAACGSGEAPR